MQRQTLIISRHHEHASRLPREALDMLLAGAAMGRKVSLLLLDAGVSQLQAPANNTTLATKPLADMLKVLPLYDIDNIFALSEDLQRFNIQLAEQLPTVMAIQEEELPSLLAAYDYVLTF